MKGSALLISKINEIQIQENDFIENGPILGFYEEIWSPHYFFFALEQKLLTKQVYQENCDEPNDIAYLQNCYNPLFYLDMPALKGAIYIENCMDSQECLSPVTTEYLSYLSILGYHEDDISKEVEAFKALHSISSPFTRSTIKDNLFRNNQILPRLSNEQLDDQASCLYIIGGLNIILNNTFEDHNQAGVDLIEQYAPKIVEYAPPGYFEAA